MLSQGIRIAVYDFVRFSVGCLAVCVWMWITKSAVKWADRENGSSKSKMTNAPMDTSFVLLSTQYGTVPNSFWWRNSVWLESNRPGLVHGRWARSDRARHLLICSQTRPLTTKNACTHMNCYTLYTHRQFSGPTHRRAESSELIKVIKNSSQQAIMHTFSLTQSRTTGDCRCYLLTYLLRWP